MADIIGKGDDNTESESSRIQKVMDSLPENIDNQARMFYYMVERARKSYREGDFISCRAQCQEILHHAFLPNFARIKALQLLSGVVPLDECVAPLDEALQICEEIEGRTGIFLADFREHDSRLRASIEAEKSRHSEEGAESGDMRERAVDDNHMEEDDEAQGGDPMDIEGGEVDPVASADEERERIKEFFLSGGLVQASQLVGIELPERTNREIPKFDNEAQFEEWKAQETDEVMEWMDLAWNYVRQENRIEDEARAAAEAERERQEAAASYRPLSPEGSAGEGE